MFAQDQLFELGLQNAAAPLKPSGCPASRGWSCRPWQRSVLRHHLHDLALAVITKRLAGAAALQALRTYAAETGRVSTTDSQDRYAGEQPFVTSAARIGARRLQKRLCRQRYAPLRSALADHGPGSRSSRAARITYQRFRIVQHRSKNAVSDFQRSQSWLTHRSARCEIRRGDVYR